MGFKAVLFCCFLQTSSPKEALRDRAGLGYDRGLKELGPCDHGIQFEDPPHVAFTVTEAAREARQQSLGPLRQRGHPLIGEKTLQPEYLLYHKPQLYRFKFGLIIGRNSYVFGNFLFMFLVFEENADTGRTGVSG